MSFAKRLSTLFLALGLILQVSCFSSAKRNADRIKNCQISFVSLSIKRLPSKGAGLFPNLEISPLIEVKNPNPEDVEIYEFDLDLYVIANQERENLGKVKNTEPQIVKAGETKQFSLVIEMDSEDGIDSKILSIGLRLIAAASRGEESEFEVSGNVYIDAGFGKLPIPVRETKKIRIR